MNLFASFLACAILLSISSMAIIGSASKSGRAGSYSGSSTDDDDLTVRQKSKPPKNALFLESDVSDDAEFADKGSELCQLGDEICAVPIELFHLPDLNNILSLDTWNFCLSEDEREFLVSFLPAFEEDDFRATMRDLLSGQNFHFGSPLADLFNRLKGGLCAPKVARYHESLKYVQRKKHYHLLRNYHNEMVNSFLEMQKSWEDCPETADIDERLEIWSSWKGEKLTPTIAQLTPGPRKRSGGAKKPKVMPVTVPVPTPMSMPMPIFRKKVEIPEERRIVVSPVPIPVAAANSRGGSKGVLKMKVIAPKAEQGGGSKSGPERELERVHVPAPKGVLKVASKGVQAYAKPDPSLREKAVILEPKRESIVREVKPTKVFKTAKPVKEVEVLDQSRIMMNPMSDEKKRSLGGDRKRKKRVDDQEIFADKQSEPQTLYVAETPPHEAHPRKRTPPQESRKKVKSFPKTFYRAFEEAQDNEEEKFVEEERKLSLVKKKASRKKPVEEHKKFVDEDDDFEHVEDRRLMIETRQDESHNGREHMDLRDDDVLKIPKRKSKKKAKETKREASPRETTPEDLAGERGASVKCSKKLSTLSVPSIASTFSFSVTHLLSAVRMALTLPCGDINTEFHNQNGAPDGAFGYEKVFLGHYHDLSLEHSDHSPGVFGDGVSHLVDDFDIEGRRRSPELSGVFDDDLPNLVGVSELDGETRTQGISLAEIVLRVQNNPGDFRILETEEPLSNLVRGALKVFSSKAARPGSKGWKPLANFDKVSRTWSWVGPVLLASSFDPPHEVLVTSEAWGVSQKTLTKMEEAFAAWLKHGQETLQQIVQLPLPPTPPALISLDEKERFRDLRAQKSLMTITASSDDMRAYFRREEILRYTLPDRAFAYTTADGRKSVVSPLRRGGGKPTSKARDHFMLKPDRPPHVTILCLVRDAAARLPGSVGTRADVCTLIRDSQYIVEDVSDLQVNQVVSGALDRLHYERDPCVKFDGERKLWMYLHTERQEDDFEDDGTSSTKRWKKPRKENPEFGELALLGYDNESPFGADQEGFESGIGLEMNSSDEMGEPSAIYSGGRTELMYCKSSSLSSPCVLVSVLGNSIREESSVPFLELPCSLHPTCEDPRNIHSVAWERVGSTAAWVSDHLHLHEPLGEEECDTEAAAAAQRDADAMIHSDTD